MKKIAFFLLMIIFLRQDGGMNRAFKGYDDVDYLHIRWQDMLSQPDRHYEVLIYSLGCSYCRQMEESIVRRALDLKQIPLFFVAVTRDMPFGATPKSYECVCDLTKMKIPGYPLLMVIQEGCATARILGYQAIMNHCKNCD
jgi:hypothetical protein